MIDPYDILGVTRDADGAAIKGAYRKQAKTSHPDVGGDVETFSKLTNSYELLIDPIRRKVYDDTGYDPALADSKDLESVLVLETLMNELILDDREPGSFDPVSAMRRKLTDQIVSARFHILEMERHRGRIRNHLDRIGKRPEADILGRMFRARTDTIGEAIAKSEAQIESIERAYSMLEGYSYEMVEVVQNAAE